MQESSARLSRFILDSQPLRWRNMRLLSLGIEVVPMKYLQWSGGNESMGDKCSGNDVSVGCVGSGSDRYLYFTKIE